MQGPIHKRTTCTHLKLVFHAQRPLVVHARAHRHLRPGRTCRLARITGNCWGSKAQPHSQHAPGLERTSKPGKQATATMRRGCPAVLLPAPAFPALVLYLPEGPGSLHMRPGWWLPPGPGQQPACDGKCRHVLPPPHAPPGAAGGPPSPLESSSGRGAPRAAAVKKELKDAEGQQQGLGKGFTACLFGRHQPSRQRELHSSRDYTPFPTWCGVGPAVGSCGKALR